MAKVCFTLRAYRRSSRGRARERLRFAAGELEDGERSSWLTNRAGNSTAQLWHYHQMITPEYQNHGSGGSNTHADLLSAFGNGLNLFLTTVKLMGRNVAGWPFLVFLSADQCIKHKNMQLVPLTTQLQEKCSVHIHWICVWLCGSFLRIWLQKEDFPNKWYSCAG